MLHMIACKSCGAMKRMHHVCNECGKYAGRQVLDVTPKKKAVTTIEA